MLCAELIVALSLAVSCLAEDDPGAEFQVVEVAAGDTLWDIAGRTLQNPAQWDQIVKHNPQLRSDPTVALPGMKLRVPVGILKPALRAARLTYLESSVEHRAREAPAWRPARLGLSLYAGDQLRTGELSRARIRFPHGSVLNMESRSLVVIAPPAEGRPDLHLVQGRLKAHHLTMKARGVDVEPRSEDAVYEIAIEEGRVTVDVYGGSADVRAAGQMVTAREGRSVSVPEGLAPQAPSKLVARDEGSAAALARRLEEARAPQPRVPQALGTFEVDFKSVPVGTTVAGVRVQASSTQDFAALLVDRTYELEERVTLKDVGLPPGMYWWRVAPVDLLGIAGKFSEPKQASVR